MFTRRCRRNCCCPMNNMDNNNSCDYETICNDVSNNCCCNNNDDCGCGYDDDNCCGDIFPYNPMFAQSYVPIQHMDKTFVPCVGLKKGTIFPELVDPYYPCQSIDFINFIKDTNKIGEGCNG